MHQETNEKQNTVYMYILFCYEKEIQLQKTSQLLKITSKNTA